LQIRPRTAASHARYVIFLVVLLIAGRCLLCLAARFGLERVKSGGKTANQRVRHPWFHSVRRDVPSNNVASNSDSVLTVSGYTSSRTHRTQSAFPRNRHVDWCQKRRHRHEGQVWVLLDDAEYKARLHQAEGQLATATASRDKAKLDYDRMVQTQQNADRIAKSRGRRAPAIGHG